MGPQSYTIGKAIYTKTAKLQKKVWPMQKKQHEKSEIKGGGPEVAVMV